jgi:2-polyprenyl-6-methoxyphenol hydroxylase-like FAD-dependent oxidoreductase
MTSVLISGASVAGPALAFWLHRYGVDVTVVEKAAAVRGGGYPIDIRGSAVDVVDRMGLLPQLRAAHIHTRRISAVDSAGRTIAAFDPVAFGHRDLELPRGDLTSVLHTATRDDAEYLFGDSIASLTPQDNHVDVTLASGGRRSFDYVVGADGLHSHTRSLAFGPESDYHHYLGHCFAGFTVPNPGLAHEAVLQNAPGRLAALYAVGEQPWVHALLAFASPHPSPSPSQIRTAFAGLGGRTPSLLEALSDADDLYVDTVSQIRMPGWVKGRIVLLGDAAYAPSFLSGQGTSLALAGAYVLAGELSRGTPEAYEDKMRGYVGLNQALAKSGSTTLLPATRTRLWMRNQALKLLPLLARTNLAGRSERRAANALALPDYALSGLR